MLFDLTHPMHPEMPVYPGKQQPSFASNANIEQHGYSELHFSVDGHTGTHIDAPAHMIPGGKTLDQFPVDKFVGRAVILKIPTGTDTITASFLLANKEITKHCEYILFYSGWTANWGSQAYINHFPVLEIAAATLLTKMNLKGIGLDMISVDPVVTDSYPIHQILLSNELVIVENLNLTANLINQQGDFYCLPLAVEKADGSPVRAIFRTV